ncbi:hypothetical protein LWI28_015253 [Acer negundo]|uniref:Aminotransferase class I/classII large domain-containing protein n=1 Tax=Acer negundo TaxID=4023 RepID=A0AAD5IUV5_ACENE|nr:hypothetical protein LWI28_015253 [Acer negundo]
MQMEKLWSKLSSRVNEELNASTDITVTVRGTLSMLMQNINPEDQRPVLSLSHGDPGAFSCFRTSHTAEQAVVDALRSAKFNCYAPFVGILPARRAVADYLSRDFQYKLSPDDVYITSGCSQAMEVIVTVVASPGANILLPRPVFPNYEAICAFSHLEIRHYDLLPDNNWEVDLEAVKELADENTVAVLVVNPGSPCGNVFSYEHLKKIAETAKELGILVVADEVYGHLTFGSNPFVPMGVFASIVPVITLGSISKRWAVTGWRIGWVVTCDPTGTLQQSKGALPDILEKTEADFFSKSISLLRETSEILCDRIREIPCLNCPTKPEGAVFIMVELVVSVLKGIDDDMDFCIKLAKEESVIVLPGVTVGLKNWLRISFAVDAIPLEDGIERIKVFCQRHAK